MIDLCYAGSMFVVRPTTDLCAKAMLCIILSIFALELTCSPALGQAAGSSRAKSKIPATSSSFKPYFLSLRFNETYMRSGPGRQYPAIWVYRRLGMPIEIVGKFDDWRKVRDFQGDTGWILSNQLRSQRAVMVTLPEVGLYEEPDTNSAKIARLGREVVARVKRCDVEWCRVLIGKHDGWTRRGGLWGIREEELLP